MRLDALSRGSSKKYDYFIFSYDYIIDIIIKKSNLIENKENRDLSLKKTIRVEQFQFIDNLEHIIDPKDVEGNYEERTEDVKKAFLENGWEGDGEIGLIWIPPFIEDTGDGLGSYVWHVKQDNNGISFLGYEEMEASMDKDWRLKKDQVESVTVTYDITKGCLDSIKKYRSYLDKVADVKANGFLQEELYNILLGAIQNELVATFVDCIDEMYLCFLKHVLDCENTDKLKLRRVNAKLSLNKICSGNGDYVDSYLIIQHIETAIWKDFKFWPFMEKFNEICNVVDYKCDEEVKLKIKCHIVIRNAFQHSDRQIGPDMMKILGKDAINLLGEKGEKIEVKEWGHIELSVREIESFCDSLEKFITNYEQHINKRMKARYIISCPIKSRNKDNKSDFESIKIELINYIYYLQYEEEQDDIFVITNDACYEVYESSTFKVNGDECTTKEFYEILSKSTEVSCNGYEFEYDDSKFVSKEPIPLIKEKKTCNIIQF